MQAGSSTRRTSLWVSIAAVATAHAAVLALQLPRSAAWRPAPVRVAHVRVIGASGPTWVHVDAAPAPSATAKPEDSPPGHEPQAVQPLRLASGRAPTAPSSDIGDDYVPRALLSVPPQPVEPIAVVFPPELDDQGRFATVLSVFINDEGFVDRVRVEGPAIAAPLEEAARRAFSSARFSPGLIENTAVRSVVRVEVVFENRPADARLAAQAAGEAVR